ncbi:DUF4350 domain-containing protein [Aliikangiella maris]|uniref:DUF4350 domain-containing protein n=2 Tax=Aliikangiella maris TaxID=3162458 RepID=A0ABV2BY52_9GAMM
MNRLINISKVTWVILIFSILIFLLASWFFNTFDRVAYQENIGASQEARQNPFLAAQLLLKQKRIEFETLQDFSFLSRNPGQFDTLLISSSRVGLTEQSRDILMQWVQQGGHLILLATEYFEFEFESSRDKFLDSLGLRFYEMDFDHRVYSDEHGVSRLVFQGYEEQTEIHFYANGYIEDISGNASFVGGTDFADQLVQYEIKSGMISVLTDFSVWENDRINKHDHAMFLLQLIGSSPKVWLVFNPIQPSLLVLAWQKASYIVISCAVLFIAFLLSNMWRQGKLNNDAEPSHREIMQHIRAAGEFSFRQDQGLQQIQVLRELIDKNMAQRVYGYFQLSLDKRLEKVAELTQIDKKKLQTLWEPAELNQDSFVELVKLIQEIRKHL